MFFDIYVIRILLVYGSPMPDPVHFRDFTGNWKTSTRYQYYHRCWAMAKILCLLKATGLPRELIVIIHRNINFGNEQMFSSLPDTDTVQDPDVL